VFLARMEKIPKKQHPVSIRKAIALVCEQTRKFHMRVCTVHELARCDQDRGVIDNKSVYACKS